MKLALRALLQHLGLASSSKAAPGIFPPLLVNVNGFFSPTITRTGVQTVLPPLLASFETFYGPSVTPGPVTVSLPLLVNANTFYGPQIALPGVTVAAPLLTNSQTFFGPKFNLNVKPPLLTNANVFFGPFVSRRAVQTIVPAKVTNTQTFFGQTLKGIARITSPSFVNVSTFYGPTVAVVGGTGEDLTQSRGALTKTGAGAVNIGSISATPYTAPASTYSLTSGTPGHWTLPTDGTTPTPTPTGDSLDLNGGPYVFAYTATVGSTTVSGDHTIDIEADAYTVSKRAEVASVLTAGIEGKTLRFARGSTDLALASFTAPILFAKWRATTSCTIANEDHSYPPQIGNTQIRLPKNLTFQNINWWPQARVGSVDRAVYARCTSPASATDQTTTNSVTFDGCTINGVADPTKTVYGFYATADGAPLTVNFDGTTTIQWVQKAFNLDDSNDHGLTINATGDCRVRYWTMDAFIPTIGPSALGSVYFADLMFMSPMYDTTKSTIHPDGIQVPTDNSPANVTIDRYTFIQADGDSISQGFFTKYSLSRIGVTINNYIYCGRSKHAMTVSGTDATHVFNGSNVTAVTQWSGIYGSTDTTNIVVDPGLVLEDHIDASSINLKNIWAQGTLANTSLYTPPASVVHGGGSGDISARFPSASWISSASLKSTALANTTANYSGLADARWTADIDTVRASVETALTPASGQVGALKSDGTRPLI